MNVIKEISRLYQLAKENSAFNEIIVYDTNELFGELGKYRVLQFADDCIQGAIDLKDQKRVMLVYQRAIVHLMAFNQATFEKVFIVGHGAGSIASDYADRLFRVAEIDEKIVELSRQFFNYNKDNVLIGDGRAILEREQSNSYDYIVLDAFTHKGTPLHFTTLEFFKLTKDKLTSHGALLMNLMGKTKGDHLMNAIHSTVSETFMYTKVFSLSAASETDKRNMIMMASDREIECQTREMAGFFEVELEAGHCIRD